MTPEITARDDVVHASAAPDESGLPPAPRSVAESRIAPLFLVELAAKVLYVRGRSALTELAAHMKLPLGVLDEVLSFMRTERLCEVARRGASDADVNYQLTDLGRERAREALGRSQYAGVAPVTLEAYCDMVEAQSMRSLRYTRTAVQSAFDRMVVDPHVLDLLGAAMNSGRAIFLHGPAGSGKTYLAERLRRLLSGSILIPHAVVIGGEIIQMFDPLVHHPVGGNAPERAALERRALGDERWVRCERPLVLSGGELRLSMLDLDYDEGTRFYQAPPHLKANNGVYIVDDFGRQQVSPRDLMNRWIVPLDRRKDYLSLRTGHKFVVPFDVVVIFSTNLRPLDLLDEAFLRRIGYKIHIGQLSEDDYRRVFRDVCEDLAIPFSEPMLQHLLTVHYRHENRPRLACHPRDLLEQVWDYAVYEGVAPELTEASLSRAWGSYFVSG